MKSIDVLRAQSFDALPFPVLLISDQLKVVDLNPRAELLLGHAAKLANQKPLSTWLLPEGDLFRFLKLAVTEGSSFSEQSLNLEFLSGEVLNCAAQAAPCDQSGVFVLALFPLVGSDNMPGRKAEQQNAGLSTLVGMLAHEIKNPLSGIKGAAQLLAFSAQEQGAEQDQELADLIASEVDRLKNLIDEMEVFGGAKYPVFAPCNIHSILLHCQQLVATGLGQHIDFKQVFDPSLPDIIADENLLKQAILNLIKNAAEALSSESDTPEEEAGHFKPIIRLHTSFHNAIKHVSKDQTRSVSYVVVGIEDNGPGIPEDLCPRVFQPSVTSKRGGKGLGLALAAQISADHKGWIDVKSEFRRTRFDIYLPIDAAALSE